MSTARYNLYRQKVYDLVKTLVIKSDDTVAAINEDLIQYGYTVNLNQPESWKYYMNMAGEYHESDALMQVTSLDTLELIDFTKENLAIHRATAREYVAGSSYYRDLVRRFPEQEDLIIGIIHPIDKDDAIAAEDGDILYYDKGLVEANEYDLIPRLQDWIHGFLHRWYVAGYGNSDDLYVASCWGVMYEHMPSAVLNIRLSNCRTEKVHSYHIREYLASNGRLDKYLDYLTTKQALFLYRNILHIRKHSGKQETLELLTQWIMTERGLPISGFNMSHNLSDMPDDILPTPELIQEPINFPQLGGRSDTTTIENMLIKEFPKAKDNSEVFAGELVETTERMASAGVDSVPTKIIESNVIDLSNRTPLLLEEFLLNHWLYWASLDRYSAFISVTNPGTGEVYRLTAIEAFVLCLYCINNSSTLNESETEGTSPATLTNIPETIKAINIRLINVPTEAQLRAICDNTIVSDQHFAKAQEDIVPVGVYISTESFLLAVTDIHKRALAHRRQYVVCEDMYERGHVEALTQRFYASVDCELQSNVGATTYAEFFEDRSIDLTGLSSVDFETMANDLLEEATGANLDNTRSVGELQRAMIGLMEQLSSYSVQYISNLSTSPYRVLDWADIRLGKLSGKEYVEAYLPNNDIDVTRYDSRIYAGNNDLDIIPEGYEESATGKVYSEIDMDAGPDFVSNSTFSENISVDTSAVRFNNYRVLGFDLPDNFIQPELDGLQVVPFGAALRNVLLNNMLNGFGQVTLPGLLSTHFDQNVLDGLGLHTASAALSTQFVNDVLNGLGIPDVAGDLSQYLPANYLNGFGSVNLATYLPGIMRANVLNGLVTEDPSADVTVYFNNQVLNGLNQISPFVPLSDVVPVGGVSGVDGGGDLTGGSDSIFLAMVNNHHGSSLMRSDIVLGGFQQPGYLKNSAMKLTGSNVSRYYGDTVVYYDRIDIAEFFPGRVIDIVTNDPVSQQNLAGFINAQTGLNVHPDEYIYTELSEGVGYVEFKDNSLVWLGYLDVTYRPAWDFTPVEDNMVEIGDTGYYRFIVDSAASSGPTAIGQPINPLNLKDWQLDVDDSDNVTLSTVNQTPNVISVPNVSNATHIDFTFDQNGGLLIVFEVDGDVFLRWFNPQQGTTVIDNLGTGITPFISPTSWNVLHDTTEVLLVYVRDGDIRYRRQLDRYGTEYSLSIGNVGAIMHGEINLTNAFVIEYFDLSDNQIKTISTESSGTWIVDEGGDVTATAELTAFTISSSVINTNTIEETAPITPNTNLLQLKITDGTYEVPGGVAYIGDNITTDNASVNVRLFQVTGETDVVELDDSITVDSVSIGTADNLVTSNSDAVELSDNVTIDSASITVTDQ